VFMIKDKMELSSGLFAQKRTFGKHRNNYNFLVIVIILESVSTCLCTNIT
jgi:hypothetical protein